MGQQTIVFGMGTGRFSPAIFGAGDLRPDTQLAQAAPPLALAAPLPQMDAGAQDVAPLAPFLSSAPPLPGWTDLYGQYFLPWSNPSPSVDALDSILHGGKYVGWTMAIVGSVGAATIEALVLAGFDTFAIGVSTSSASPVGLHVTYGWSSGAGAYTWAHGAGAGLFTTDVFAAAGSIFNITRIPIWSAAAIASWVGTKPDVGNCLWSAIIAIGKGWGF